MKNANIIALVVGSILSVGCVAGFVEHKHDATIITQKDAELSHFRAVEVSHTANNNKRINDIKQALAAIQSCDE